MEVARAGPDRRSETIVRQPPDSQDSTVPFPDIEQVIEDAAAGLRGLQHDDGHWLFELEADATIPAEYVLLNHFLDEIDPRPRRASASTSGRVRPITAAGRSSTAVRSTLAAPSRPTTPSS